MNNINIFNIRLGFATNSSSSHSIMWFEDKDLKELRGNQEDDTAFGWGDFVLKSKGSKLNYLQAQVCENLSRQKVPEKIIQQVASLFLGEKPKPNKSEMSVDHQSVFCLPKDFEYEYIDMDFLKDFKKFILQDNIVIFGGNDNDADEHTSYKALGKDIGVKLNLEGGSIYSPVSVCRKDGDFWVVFNKDNGTKVRFSFNANKKEYKKSKYPELVDLKIIDYCESNCPYCYQNSSIEGKYVDKQKLYSIFYRLSDHKVFEVAIGGGDVMSHPDIMEILGYCRNLGMIPNISVRSTSWLHDEKKRRVLELCGGIAFSVSNSNEIENIDKIFTDLKLPKNKVTFQVILELVDLADIIKACKNPNETYWLYPLTILGVKDVGRGKGFEWKKVDESWVKLVSRSQSNTGIDTILARKYHDDLDKYGVSRLLRTEEEGKFSMYIDAVNGKFGESSYCDTLYDFNPDKFNWFDEMMKKYKEF